jgi:hypothetical protein
MLVENVESDVSDSWEQAERRSKVRFPLVMRACYRTFEHGSPHTGAGSVVNMSRNGVLISAKHGVNVGRSMELSIEWPARFHGRVPLRFVSAGIVVRCDASSFALKLVGRQFRTAKRKVTPFHLVSENESIPSLQPPAFSSTGKPNAEVA